MGDYGFKVSNAGYGVTETDPRRYAFWSKYATVKIYLQGSGTVTIPSGSSSAYTDINHGLSFIPMYLLFSQLYDGSGKWFLNRSKLSSGDADAGDQYVDDTYSWSAGVYTETGLYIDATKLHIEYKTYNTASSHDVDYYYFIFADEGGT